MSFVLNASVALVWCFEAEHTEPVIALLARLTETGASVPQLWPLEALNGLIMAERRGRIDLARRDRLARFLRQLPVAIDDETTLRLWDATAQLAERHRLTAYDATYLELALRLALPLATVDRALMAAANATGVRTLPAA